MAIPAHATRTMITAPMIAMALAVPPTSTHAANPYPFDNLALFQSQTAATATAALSNVGLAAPQPFTVGDLSFSNPSGDNIFIGTGDATQWTALNAGHDIAISSTEDLNIDLAAPVTAFGFEFIEPQTGVPGFVDSTFTVELFDGITSVGTFTFQRPNDQLTHVAAASPAPFDRVEIRETTGAGENEFFGQFYTANTNNKFWDNLNFGHWGTTTNWDPTGTPAPTDNVFITPNTTNDIGVFGPTTPTTIASLTIANTNPAKNTTFILDTTGPLTLTGDLLVDQNGHLDVPTGATLSGSGTNGTTGTPATNANNFTIDQGQLTLEGTANFNGGAGADSISGTVDGGDGADAQQINFTNATVNIDDGTLNANGGAGGHGFDGGADRSGGGQGGNGGQLTIDDNANVTLTNTAAINLRGGAGGNASTPSGVVSSGLGGHGGSLTLDTNANLTLNNASINIRGGNGGGVNSEEGHAGHGGTVTLDNNADLTLTNATIDLSGGQGGPAGDGGNAGTITATQGDLSLTNATLNLNGGNGGPERHPNGGNGGQLTITNGNHTIDNSTLNLNGGSGVFHSILGGGGGNGGLININGGTTTLQNAPTINLKPGTGGSPSPGAVNITAGTLNIDSALITANDTTPSADPINIIAAPLTLSGTGTLNLNNNATLSNTTNINNATTYNQTGDLTILGTLNINHTATLNAPSFNDAHNLTVDGGTFSLNGTANFNGDDGNDGINFSPNGTNGGDAPTITLTDATTTLHPGSTLNATGGNGGDGFDPFVDFAGNGGHGATLNATNGTLNINDATLNLRGGNPGFGLSANPGNPATVNLNNTDTTISGNSLINLSPGNGGSSLAQLIITDGTLNLNAGQITADTSFTPTTPIAIVSTTTTITGAPTININDDLTLHDTNFDLPDTATFNLDTNATINAQDASSLTLHGPRTIEPTQAYNILTNSDFYQHGDLTVQGPLFIDSDSAILAPAPTGAVAYNLTVQNATFTLGGHANFSGPDGITSPRTDAGNGPQINLDNATLDLTLGATFFANGGNGGQSSSLDGSQGANGGIITLQNNANLTLNNATFNLDAGDGGEGNSGSNAGDGGQLIVTLGNVTLTDATLTLRGGKGGNTFGVSDPSATPPDAASALLGGGAGAAGDGGNVTLTQGNLTLTNSNLNLNAGNGGSGGLNVRPGGAPGQINITNGTATVVNSTIDINGGKGGANAGNNLDGDGSNGGQLTITDGTLNLDQATVNLNGGNAGLDVPTPFPADPGNGGALNLNGGTTTVMNTTTVNLLPGTAANTTGTPGSINVNNATLNIEPAATLNATPPQAPLNTPGTPAYSFNADTANISVQGTINLNGGHGGTSFDDFDGELGGAGPTITLNNATTTLHPTSTFNANGGGGGDGKGEFSVTNGDDGNDGAQATVTGGSLNINAATFNLNGGNGGDSDFYAGGTGGNGGQLTLTLGNLNIDAAALNLKGGNGGESWSTHQSTGGNGGTLNLQGGTTTLSNAATINLSPGIGDSEGPINPGLPGNLTLAGTATLNINSATVTADTTFTPTTPIAIVNTPSTITGTPTINLNDDTTLENSDLDLPPTATFNLDPAAALTAQNNASLTLHGDRTIPSTQAIHILSGSTFRNYGGFNVQGQLNIAGGTLNASTADNDLLPPAGQDAHHLTIDGGTFSTTTLTRFDPGEGAEGPDGQNGGNGATIHLISGLLNLDGGTLLAPGGNGGNSNDEPGSGGHGGHGGNATVSDGLLLSFGGTLNLAGGAGGIGETQAGSGGNAGNLNIDGGEATFNGGTIFMQGGVPEAIIHGGDGGDGGHINVTGGNFFAGTTTIDLQGRNGGNGDLSNGAPGNGGSLHISGGTTTFNFATHVDMTPGNGGTPGQLNLTGGTLNLHEATITGNNAAPAADPINLVGTTFNVSNTGHLKLTDTTRIADATLNQNDGTTIESISMNVGAGSNYNLNAGVLTGSPTPTISPDPITLFNTSVALTAGNLNLNDNATMNGGFISRSSTSNLNLAPGKRLTAINNAQIDLFDNTYEIIDNTTLEITDGSTLTTDIFLGVGLGSSGTLLVDNATIQTGSAGPFNAPWGLGVGHADVTIRNNATANFGNNIEFVGSGAPGHSGTLRLQSGADMTVHNLDIASDSSGNATVLVDGPGTTLTQIGPATLDLGASSFNSATLSVTNNAVFTTGTGPIDINPTGNLTVDTGATFNANAPTTVDGTINLAGGTMDATDINLNPSGAFNFTGGTLHVDNFTGTLDNTGGTLAPGHSPGITTITEDYSQASTATLQIEVLNPATPTPGAGADNDQLNITANVSFAGTLEIVPLPDNGPLTDAFPGALGTTFDILNYGTRTPDTYFDTITGTLLATDFALAPLHNEFFTGIILRASIPGDLNLDNKVSVADLSFFALNFNTTPGLYNEASNQNSWELGDFNTDGAITVADLSLLALNFGFELLPDGTTTPPTPLTFAAAAYFIGIDPAAISGVPEPATTTTLIIALGWPARTRRRVTSPPKTRPDQTSADDL